MKISPLIMKIKKKIEHYKPPKANSCSNCLGSAEPCMGVHSGLNTEYALSPLRFLSDLAVLKHIAIRAEIAKNTAPKPATAIIQY